MINSISTLITERLENFRSKMITMINKNGDQPVSLEDRESYYEAFEAINLPKIGKSEARVSRSYGLSASLKNSTENNKNGPVVGENGPISNNDDGNGIPAKGLCC